MAAIGSSVLPQAVDAGTPFYLRGEVPAVPSGSTSVLSYTVPALQKRSLRQLWVTALNDGHFSLEADGVQIATGRIDNVAHNVSFTFDPPRSFLVGVVLELFYNSDDEPTHICPVTAFLSGVDVVV